MTIAGNFTVNGTPFAQWFEQWRRARQADFPHALHLANFEAVMRKLKVLMCKSAISLSEFVAIFCVIYNETGGTFRSMKEVGGATYYQLHGYGVKSAGRGYIQITSDGVYRRVLSLMGYEYDAMSAEQLDALFLRPEIALRATCIYLSDSLLAGNHWRKVQTGEFYAFGVAISGGSSTYGQLFDRRCQALRNALQGAKLAQPFTNRVRWWVWVLLGVLLLLVVLFLAYRFRPNASKPAAPAVLDTLPAKPAAPAVLDTLPAKPAAPVSVPISPTPDVRPQNPSPVPAVPTVGVLRNPFSAFV